PEGCGRAPGRAGGRPGSRGQGPPRWPRPRPPPPPPGPPPPPSPPAAPRPSVAALRPRRGALPAAPRCTSCSAPRAVGGAQSSPTKPFGGRVERASDPAAVAEEPPRPGRARLAAVLDRDAAVAQDVAVARPAAHA